MNEESTSAKEAVYGLIIFVLIVLFIRFVVMSPANPNCQTEGDGTIQCD